MCEFEIPVSSRDKVVPEAVMNSKLLQDSILVLRRSRL